MSVERHALKFSPAPENWDQAFPFGNGRLGAMGYQPPGRMVLSINQLDVSASPYHWLDEYPQYQPLEHTRKRALEARANPADPAHQDYNKIMHEDMFREYGYPAQQLVSPHCGEFELEFAADENTPATAQELSLAQAVLTMRRGSWQLTAFASAAHECILLEIDAGAAEWREVNAIVYRPDPLFPATLSGHTKADFPLTVAEVRPSDDFHFAVGIGVVAGAGLESTGTEVRFIPEPGTRKIVLAIAVETSFRSATPKQIVCEWLQTAAQDGLDAVRNQHRAWWRDFWAQSGVRLGDDMLEFLWYYGNYTFASGNGRGCGNSGICGLYGLWYHAPTIWHNGMVEDVNIQQAFWHVFTSGHAELAAPLIEAIEKRLPAARAQARNWYGCAGAAFGYYPMQCIGPWFCEYLWWYYSYRGDETFLKERTYPIFREVLTFFEDFASVENGKLVIFPSVSPEQGPVCANDTQTLAALKFLLHKALYVAEHFGFSADAPRWRALLDAMPDYPRSSGSNPHIKDSEWADDDLFLAHPGVLHPLYPGYEVTGPAAAATLAYVEHHQALGTFNFTWLAAAAAAAGDGDDALRFLYDKGICHLLKANGLFAELTSHFVQACSVLYSPGYGSALLESSSGTVAALNAMLLQSRPEGIAVFPAVPTAWREVEFTGLAAEVQVRVSAVRRDARTVRIELSSPVAQQVRLRNAFGAVPVSRDGAALAPADAWTLTLTPGRVTVLTATANSAPLPKTDAAAMPLVHRAPNGRRIFIGADQDTAFQEAVDSFYYPVQLGMFEVPKATRYKFDFGEASARKHYAVYLPQQQMPPNKVGRDFVRVGRDYAFDFRVSSLRWLPGADCAEFRRAGTDCLRFDGLCGRDAAELELFFTAGSYRMLLVSGDPEAEDNGTQLQFPDGRCWQSPSRSLGHAVISFDIGNSGDHRLKLFAKPGLRWYINLCIINQNF